jgi:uncharacterized protein YbjT (DUF2867 family)
MTSKRRILVLGATGTVGSEVVRALLRRDDVRIRVGVRRSFAFDPSAEVHFDPRVEVVAFDYHRPETFEAAFCDVDAFFFVSPLVDDQLPTSLRALEIARECGVSHCVRLSSRATGWDEISVLRRWHREIEAAIVRSGMRWTMLRPCSFMQNVLGPPLSLVRSRGIFSIPLGNGRIPFVDAKDLGDAAALCLSDEEKHHARTYVLTGSAALSGDDVAAVLSRVRSAPVRYVASDRETARAAAVLHGAPEWLVDSGLRVYARAEHGEEAIVDDTLARLLDRAPTTFEAFAERHRRDLQPR